MARAIAPAFFVLAMIYAIGDVSGLHINPAVTLGFTVKRLFPARWLPAYWIAQLVWCARSPAWPVVVLFGHEAATHAVTEPHGIEPWVALVLEVFLTWALVTVILGTADRAHWWAQRGARGGRHDRPVRARGPAARGRVDEPGSINRSCGRDGRLSSLWIYWLGPMIGALIAVAFADIRPLRASRRGQGRRGRRGKRG